jgi:hypothetical protein
VLLIILQLAFAKVLGKINGKNVDCCFLIVQIFNVFISPQKKKINKTETLHNHSFLFVLFVHVVFPRVPIMILCYTKLYVEFVKKFIIFSLFHFFTLNQLSSISELLLLLVLFIKNWCPSKTPSRRGTSWT